MKFERVDEKTVRCFISNEELEGYQIDYKDFVTRSEKAREIVRDIIEQATEEVGYRPPKFAFDMSIMMMPEQGVVLTFSESDPLEDKAGGKLMEYLKEMKRAWESAAAGNPLGAEEKSAANSSQADNSSRKTKIVPEEQIKLPELGIFAFDRLGEVMDLASAMPTTLRVHSVLYAMDGRYYLYIQRGAASYQRYSKLCIQAMEFGELYGAAEEKLLFLQEHASCLIPEKALKKLSSNKSEGKKNGEKKAGR